jgi:2-polyprenyl-3-methyl-5-hydroxy-6-metoxy-1,4-benzoquinol methylase
MTDTPGRHASAPNANPLDDYRRYVIEAWAVYIAVEVHLFEALTEPSSLSALAERQGWDVSALRPLVRALVATGHLARHADEVYGLTARSRELLLPTSQGYIGNALAFLRTSSSYLKYPEVLRGGPAVGLTDSQWAYVTRGSAIYADAGVRTLLESFGALWARRPLRILDVGCGQGAYLLKLAKALPGATLLGIDPTASVVADATRRLEELGSRAPEVRQALLEDVNGSFDAILINQIFHVVGIDAARIMLEQACVRLAPGGYVFVQEILDGKNQTSPALFGLNMRLLFEQGCVLSSEELSDLLVRAGLHQVTIHEIDGPTPGLAYVSGRL